MVRPFPFLAALLMLLALAFYIIAAATSHWLVSYQPNIQMHEGVYNACWRQYDVAINECRHVNNDCTADFSAPVDSFTLTDSCNELRAVRAFIVLSIIFAGLSFLALYLLSFTKVSHSSTQHTAQCLDKYFCCWHGHLTVLLCDVLLCCCAAVLCCSVLSTTAAVPHAAPSGDDTELPHGLVRTGCVGYLHLTE